MASDRAMTAMAKPSRACRLTISAACANVTLVIPRVAHSLPAEGRGFMTGVRKGPSLFPLCTGSDCFNLPLTNDE